MNVTEHTIMRELECKRVIVKIGSSLLTAHGQGLDHDAISGWAAQLAHLKQQGYELLLVSSGAVAEGMVRMNMTARPTSIPEVQACASIGQMGLIELWSKALLAHGVQSSQILMTHDDLSNRQRYLNIGDTLSQLIDWQVVPVINENDTVAIDEIKFGDNDSLAAMVAGMVDADLLVLLTDQHGMFDADPRSNPEAKLLATVRAMDDRLLDMAGDGGKFGRGGMVTKVRAARLAAMAGCPTIIASGDEDQILTRLLAGEEVGTLFTADEDRLIARKQWLAAHLQMAGRLIIDDGAVRAIRDQKRSLLPIGVRAVEGEFRRGDVVECVSFDGKRVAVGRVNFNNDEAAQILRQHSEKIEDILGERDSTVMIHRDHMAVF